MQVIRQDAVRPPLARIEHNGACVSLPLGTVYVGRGASCFLRINHPCVSRIHLSIEVSDKVVVRDLSSNGTLVNQEPLVGSRTLADGDVLTLCTGRSLRVLIEPFKTLGEEGETAVLLVRHYCPRCRNDLAADAARCERCGLSWRTRPDTATEPVNDAVADRRAERRHRTTVSARYRGGLETGGIVSNISAGGLFLVSDDRDEPGTKCSIELRPVGMQPATFTGSVVRVIGQELGRSGMGIRFDPLQGHLTRWLAQYLLKQLHDNSTADG